MTACHARSDKCCKSAQRSTHFRFGGAKITEKYFPHDLEKYVDENKCLYVHDLKHGHDNAVSVTYRHGGATLCDVDNSRVELLLLHEGVGHRRRSQRKRAKREERRRDPHPL